MAENIQTPATGEEPASQETYTKEQVEAIVQKRLANVKAQPPSDYEELKAIAEKSNEAQEALKGDLQKALEERDRWKADYAELKESNDRRDAVEAAAIEYGVDAATLMRMDGDVEDNARFLKEKADAAPKYPSVFDGGQQAANAAHTTAQQFADAINFL